MSIACVFVANLPLKTELLRQPDLRGKAALIIEQSGSRKLVIDRSPPARAVEPGMSLEKALSLCPHAALVEADSPLYRERWSGILDNLEQRSPIVEDAGLGLAYVDLRGLEKLYNGEANLLKAMVDAVPQAYYPRAGVAQGKFPAYAAALQAKPSRAVQVPEDAAAFLSPLPVTHLPTSWKVRERLLDFGLDSMGSVARLPFNTMQAEFGREGARLWRLANGRDDEHVGPSPSRGDIHPPGLFRHPPRSSLPVYFDCAGKPAGPGLHRPDQGPLRQGGLSGRVCRERVRLEQAQSAFTTRWATANGRCSS